MKLGLFTDSLADLSFVDALAWAASHRLEAVEIGTGNFSSAPHCDVDTLINDQTARATFKTAIDHHALVLSALNCSGNLLDPDPTRGQHAQDTFYKTVQAAALLGIEVVVTMSGCPGDPAGARYPNWVIHPWQQEFYDLYQWQWDEVVLPFWSKAGAFAADHGIKIAIEMHPGQMVYNTRTLLRLRDHVGPHLGANLDPSHLFYQGMDPILVIRHLGEQAVFHVHAKDTRLDPYEMALNGGLDPRPMSQVTERSWGYRTVGFGHDALWWRDFVSALRAVGYDGVLSIEHEDLLMSPREGIRKSIDFLEPILLRTVGDG